MATTTTTSNKSKTTNNTTTNLYANAALFLLFLKILQSAYQIRLRAIDEYGPVIHEFDPYFNFRATEVRFLHT